jgi:hypothetical protein
MDAEPHTRSSAALAAALFSASANDSGDAASGEFGRSKMTWFSAMTPPCFSMKVFEMHAALSLRFWPRDEVR